MRGCQRGLGWRRGLWVAKIQILFLKKTLSKRTGQTLLRYLVLIKGKIICLLLQTRRLRRRSLEESNRQSITMSVLGGAENPPDRQPGLVGLPYTPYCRPVTILVFIAKYKLPALNYSIFTFKPISFQKCFLNERFKNKPDNNEVQRKSNVDV